MLSPFQWNRENYHEYRDAGRVVFFTSIIALIGFIVPGAACIIYDKDFDGDPATGGAAFLGSALALAGLAMILKAATEKKALSSEQTRVEEDEYEDEE